ncbi:MAG: alkaline phosphatase family protein [Streptosporangiales bacterium]|nr:alkaline phosphatase family protein [Streptosporangiales bacterium]
MPRLVLGPLLRYVDETTAAVWVETDAPCEVGVLDAAARTFTVHGHHYGLVEIEGLAPGSVTPYTVLLDGEQVWPEPDSPFPPPRIRTLDPEGPLRLVFGSCRRSAPHDELHNRVFGVDAMRAYASRLAAASREGPAEEWPDALLLLGDQVYADSPSAEVRAFLAARRDLDVPPGAEVADFAEYAYLYRQAWSEPVSRWLLSTVQTAMIFDDHDIRDDWNTSHAWRQRMGQLPWWRDRIVAGLGSYWIYQHLGNLSPAERAADPVLADVREAAGDAGPVLDEFARTVDAEPESYRWSYGRDFAGSRLIALDTRCGRVLQPGRRDILDPPEWAWFDRLAKGGRDHLFVATSLPYLLPASVHHLERWNEAVCDGRWGRRAAAAAERLRQAIDLEHWSAFQRSFDAMARVAAEVAAGRRGTAPRSVLFLSGDVHYSYFAGVTSTDEGASPRGMSPICQAVCSPVRNPLDRSLRWASRLSSTRAGALVGRALCRIAGTLASPLDWRIERGPWFHNCLLTLEVDGRSCSLHWEAADLDGTGDPALHRVDTVRLR